MKFVGIEAKELRPTTLVFTKTGWIDFHECYLDYVCPKCGKLNWLEATKAGIHAPIKLPAKLPDIFQTSDFRAIIVSAKTRKAIESFQPGLAEFYPIPNHKTFFVLLPTRLIKAPAKVPVCDDWILKNGPWRSPEQKRCTKCKLFPELCFRRSWFTVPDDVVFAGIVVDTKSMTLVASPELADHLRQAKLEGMKFQKNEFANEK